ncbi:hypothetical protein [Streptomyces sp. NPDC046985]|uniref:hypothetical protein n=1 Tax=Streptomyces sp. NPDC046985 TaxID=3155377 RepID=UPI0033E6E6F5
MPASILEEGGRLLGAAWTGVTVTRLVRPSRGALRAARPLGDDGGASYACTACGRRS